MLGGRLRVPIGEAGVYWLGEPGGEAVEVGTLRPETSYVELTYMILDDPDAELAPSYRVDAERVTARLTTSHGLEVRDLHGRAHPIGDATMGYSAWVLREPGALGRDERHDLVLRPDRFVEGPDVRLLAYLASLESQDELVDVQRDALVQQVDRPWPQNGDETSRRLAHAIVRALESASPEDPDQTGAAVSVLADDLARLGAFEASVSESGLGLTAHVDARPLIRAVVAVAEGLLSQSGLDRDVALAAAIRAADGICSATPSMPVPVREGRAGIADRVRSSVTPLVRTDFSDDGAWDAVVAAVSAPQDIEGELYDVELDVVSEAALAGLTPDELAADWPQEVYGYVLLADARSMTSGDPTVLYVDLRDERGRSFRCAAGEVASIRDNLDIDNMDYEDFADAVGQDGVFRGF